MPKKVKKKKSGKSKSEVQEYEPKPDPIPGQFVPPAPKPMEKLIKLLTTHKVEEKDLYGIKVSTRALEKLTPQEIRDLRVVFEAFDTQERGVIGPVDVRKAMRALGFKVSREEARQLVQDASIKGKSFVDFNEFLDIIIESQGDDKDVYEEILQGFSMFDYEDAGKISIENLKMAAKETKLKFSNQDLEDMMTEADLNGDGYVDKEEFVKIMLQTNLF